MDERLFSHCNWHEFNSKACGGPAAFINSGIGYCAVIAGGVVSEAYAAFIGRGLTDIGAFTAPDYRGRGYGYLTCSVLIADCESRGLETRWACTATNMASRALARSLGYRTQISFQLARYKSRRAVFDPT
jgi:RimJ/RimL family protein N-acetyltransferase